MSEFENIEIIEQLIVGRVEPYIYAFSTNTIPNYLKVGDTIRGVPTRLSEWRQCYPDLEEKYQETAKLSDDVYFRDYAVHSFLENDLHKIRLEKDDIPQDVYYSNEFFKDTEVKDVQDAISDIKDSYSNNTGKYPVYNAKDPGRGEIHYERSNDSWEPRPNQSEAVNNFKKARKKKKTNLLMYAVMRFGKSFTSMLCAVEMKAKIVVVVSAKADVADEWKRTVEIPANFDNYVFINSKDLQRDSRIISKKRKEGKSVVVFLTLQDLQGETIKDKHKQIFGKTIDLLIVDETHFGARAQKFGQVLEGSKHAKDDDDYIDTEEANEQLKVLSRKVTLHLSGTPYRILMGSEFDKDSIIAFCQYSDIVDEQENWDKNESIKEGKKEWDNPYFGFPQMIRFAFNPNESARRKLEELKSNGSTYALSQLFKPQSITKVDDDSHKRFVYEPEVLDLLSVIDGSKDDSNLFSFLDYDKIKEGAMCHHMVFVLPYCASCDAMQSLIEENRDKFKNLGDYEIINISGVDVPNQFSNTAKVKQKIKECEADGKKTITLTVNRMLTGSTVEEWDTMLYLKDTASPQEYDQATFRLQNQYIKTYVDKDDNVLKRNMKPQTLLVDLDPNRMFVMQELKAQIYNANVDKTGNTKLAERLEKELKISPIIVANQGKIIQITQTDVLTAISEYSKDRGVAEETNDIPIDLQLLDIKEIRDAIEKENELGSKAGFSKPAAEGDGTDLDIPDEDEVEDDETGTDDDKGKTGAEKKDEEKDIEKQFKSYYAKILFYAFLTKDTVISLAEIVKGIGAKDNARIAHNLGLSKISLAALEKNLNPFHKSKFDYKIQNINKLGRDESLSPIERAETVVQKIGKLGDSEVITPSSIANEMVGTLTDEVLNNAIANSHKILDIASKTGEFAIALYKRYSEMGKTIDDFAGLLCSIPTSSMTYEFTRKVYDDLGLPIENIASQFNSYDLIHCKNNNGIDYDRISKLLTQKKPFSKIGLSDEVSRMGRVKFAAVVGNPPYQEKDGGARASSKPIYHYFVDLSKKLTNQYSSLIIPSRWYAGGKGLDEFRESMLNDNHITCLHDFLHPEEVFPDTNNRGGVCFFAYDKGSDNNGNTIPVITHEGSNKTC